MPVLQNKFPVLEFDPDCSALVMPNILREGVSLPDKAVFAFVGDHVDSFAESVNADVATSIDSITKQFLVYVCRHKGQDICLVQAPMGAPAAVQNLDVILSLGVKTVLATGSCGVLHDIPENQFIVPFRALRAEGTSYQYAPPSRFIDLDPESVTALCNALDKRNIPYLRGTTWSTDCFFRETASIVQLRREEGCDAVDMECSALAACAQFRGARFAQLFFTADSLANVNDYDCRGFGVSSREKALELCVDLITDM